MSVQKILLLRPNDATIFQKVLNRISGMFPDSSLTVLELKKQYSESMVNPSFNKILYPGEFPFFSPLHCGWKFLSLIRKKKYDLIIFVYESEVISQFTYTLLFVFCSGVRKKIAIGPRERIRELSNLSIIVRLLKNIGVKTVTLLLTCFYFPFVAAIFIPVFVTRHILLKQRKLEIPGKDI